MLVHPNFDPIAFSIGPVHIRWYGLMYLVGFACFFLLGRYRLGKQQFLAQSGLKPTDVEDLLFHGAMGVVLGGRLGYCLFYKPAYYLSHPLEIFAVWQGGMSFHGGLIGVILGVVWFAHRRGVPFLAVTDFMVPISPLGLAAVRVANFINGELWGRVTTVPWGMIFPQAGDGLPRHPSQLYQAAGEGLLLFVILWLFTLAPRRRGAASGMFLLGYGVARSLAELAREPDSFLGYLGLGATMGQWLSFPMIIGGLYLLWRSRNQPFHARES